jgi:hypothetical protein
MRLYFHRHFTCISKNLFLVHSCAWKVANKYKIKSNQLRYYYSGEIVHTTSFWNIIIQRTSHDDLTEKLVSLVSLAKLVKWQKCKTALCDLTEKLLVSNFIGRTNLQIILEAKSMYESS